MFELRGAYGSAKIYADICEENAIAQIINMLNQKFIYGSNVRIMPDVHAGKGCTIGTTLTITDKVVPNLVGVDIGCGMEVTELSNVNELNDNVLTKLDNEIRTSIPSGCRTRALAFDNYAYESLNELRCINNVDIERAAKSIGTLGGGNHFIELDKSNKDNSDKLYLVVHSGSRHLGLNVAHYYQNKAIEYKNSMHIAVPDDLAYCEGELFNDYIHDMEIVQKFAYHNRLVMSNIIVDKMGWAVNDRFTTIHNYIDTENMILRKGAVSAKLNEKLIIPMNMRDGSLICVGKGNDDWNQSAPHGAGRLMSRSDAKDELTLDKFKDEMAGIFTTSVCRGTLDESPMAYKPMNTIVENIKDTVDIIEVVKPVYNFKASK